MKRKTLCLDSSVLVKILVPEEGSYQATSLLWKATVNGYRLVAPAFAWAEVGTTLLKKVRSGLITRAEADTAWGRFVSLGIEHPNDPRVPSLAWEICSRFDLPTMYDAAFLAVCESMTDESPGGVEFWTADRALVQSLGDAAPQYVRLICARQDGGGQ